MFYRRVSFIPRPLLSIAGRREALVGSATRMRERRGRGVLERPWDCSVLRALPCGRPSVFIISFPFQAARLCSLGKVHDIPKKHHLTFSQRTWQGGGELMLMKKWKKAREKETHQGLFDLLSWHQFSPLCLLLAGDRCIFPGEERQRLLPTARFRNAISKLPAEMEGVFAKTVDGAKLLPGENPPA